jgi:hypothetical protein
VSLIVQAEADDGEALRTTIETAQSQTWPAVEVIVAEGELDAALAASQGEFVSVVSAGTRLRDRAVHMGLGLPVFRRGLVLFGENWYQEFDAVLAAAEDVRSVVPRDAKLILIDEDVGRPRTLGTLLEYPIGGGHPADDDHAIRDLESLRERGAAWVAFFWPAFWWLKHYTGLDRHLRTSYRSALENDRVIVFDLS